MRVRLGLLACVLAVALGCGGGGGGGGSSNGGGEAIDPDQREASITRINEEYVQFAPRSNPANRDAFIQSVLEDESIASAGWSEEGDNFWATFSDGAPYAIIDNRPPDGDPGPISVSGPTRVELPRDATARVLFSLGTAFTNRTTLMKGMLETAGYTVVTGSGELDSLLEDVQGDGVFYWDTHSGFVNEGKPDEMPVITTLTALDPEKEKTDVFLKNLLANKMLIRSGSGTDTIAAPVDENQNGKIDYEERIRIKKVYAITPKFIETYFKFKTGSVVMQDSCTSGDDRFAAAFKKAGAHVYLGWDAVTKGGNAMPLFADRLLGANTLNPKPNPPLRPFDSAAVIAWMAANNLNTDGATATLKLALNTGVDGAILRPSIRRMTVDEESDELLIQGRFGTPPEEDRKVTINGAELDIVSWAHDLVRVTLPRTGANASGEVKVWVRGSNDPTPLEFRESNPVMLTEWQGALKIKHVVGPSVEGSSGQNEVNGTMSLRFRADVHSFRNGPGDAPVELTEIAFDTVHGATYTYTASGTLIIANGDVTTSNTWSGSGSILHAYEEAALETFFAGGKIDAKNRKVTLKVNYFKDEAFNSHHVLTTPDNTLTDDVPMPMSLDTVFDIGADLTLTMNSDYSIAAGQANGIGKFQPLTGVLIEWQAFSVKHAPPADTARGR